MNELVTIDKLQADEEMFINAIIESEGGNLPTTINNILPIISFTKAKASAFKSIIQSTKKIEEQKEIHQSALESGQRYAQVALYSEAKLGDLLKETTLIGRDVKAGGNNKNTTELRESGALTLSDIGIDRHQSFDSQIIAKASHDGTLEEVIEKAKENNDMPTKNAVITAMRKKQVEKARENFKVNNKPDPKPEINQELFKIAESLTGINTRISRMSDFVDCLNEDTKNRVIRNCKNIIDILEETINV